MRKRLLGEAFHNWYRNIIRHPKWRWWVLLGTLFYLISPIDISPDFIPAIGWIDDGLIATLAVTELSQILLESRRRLSDKAETVQADEVTGTVIDVPAITVG
ncbi:MAG TPA: YkvA family protein [Trichocoleus sp.]